MATNVTKIGKYNAIIYTPDGATGKLPVFIEIPGKGECGTDPNLLYLYGGLYFVKNKAWKPNFIIIGAQPDVGWPPDRGMVPLFMRTILDAVVQMPNVDTSRVYLTGYSNGSATIMEYMQYEDDAHYHPIAAVIPMSMNMFATGGDYNAKTDQLAGGDLRFRDTPIWAFCGDKDAFRETEARYCDLVVKHGGKATYTEWPYGTVQYPHGGWNTPYDPNYKNPTSIWDWALQYPAPKVAPPPITTPVPKTLRSVQIIYTYSDGSTETITR